MTRAEWVERMFEKIDEINPANISASIRNDILKISLDKWRKEMKKLVNMIRTD